MRRCPQEISVLISPTLSKATMPLAPSVHGEGPSWRVQIAAWGLNSDLALRLEPSSATTWSGSASPPRPHHLPPLSLVGMGVIVDPWPKPQHACDDDESDEYNRRVEHDEYSPTD